MGESIPLSVERIRELYVDHADYNKRWDGAVDDLVQLGLVLPEAVAAVKARGRALYESALASKAGDGQGRE